MTRGTKANHLTGRPRDAPLRRVTTLTEHLCTGNKGTASKRLWLPVFRDVLHKQHAALTAVSREGIEYKRIFPDSQFDQIHYLRPSSAVSFPSATPDWAESAMARASTNQRGSPRTEGMRA